MSDWKLVRLNEKYHQNTVEDGMQLQINLDIEGYEWNQISCTIRRKK